MDNTTKGENLDLNQGQPAGEIFSNDAPSAYQDVVQSTPEGNLEQSSPFVGATDAGTSNLPPPEDQGYPTAQGTGDGGAVNEPPPPFVEDNRKKFIVVGIIVVFFLLLFALIFKFITGRKPAPSAKTNVILTYWGLWEEEEIVKPIFDEYTKANPNIKIVYVRQDPKQYRERLQASIDRGEGPDLFRFHNTWTPMFINYLSPMPKTVYSDSEYESTFYPVVRSDLKLGQNYVGIPLMIDGLLLYYNEDILKGANVQVPVTWVDMQNVASKITVKEKGRIVTSAIALGTAENIEHFSDILALMMLQNGTKIGKSLFSCADELSTTCGVEAFSFYRKFAELPNNSWDETLDNSILAFAGGKTAMIIAPSWEAQTISTINPNLKFKTASMPQLPCEKAPCPSVNFATYWVEGVSAKSKNQAAAWALLKYLSSADTLQKLYGEEIKFRKLFGEPYPRIDLGKTLSDNPYLAPLIAEAPTMKSFFVASRTFDGDTGLDTSLIAYLKDAVNSLNTGTSPETALKTVDAGFQQVFARFGFSTSQ